MGKRNHERSKLFFVRFCSGTNHSDSFERIRDTSGNSKLDQYGGRNHSTHEPLLPLRVRHDILGTRLRTFRARRLSSSFFRVIHDTSGLAKTNVHLAERCNLMHNGDSDHGTGVGGVDPADAARERAAAYADVVRVKW